MNNKNENLFRHVLQIQQYYCCEWCILKDRWWICFKGIVLNTDLDLSSVDILLFLLVSLCFIIFHYTVVIVWELLMYYMVCKCIILQFVIIMKRYLGMRYYSLVACLNCKMVYFGQTNDVILRGILQFCMD